MSDTHPSPISSPPSSAPDSAVSAAPTGTLSITTEPSPLAVTICDYQINTVARGVSPAQIQLAPGLYMVRASRVGHPDLTQFAWVVSNSDRSVCLSESAPGLLAGARTAVSVLLDRYIRNVPQFESTPRPELATGSDIKLDPFWIRFFRLKDWDSAEQIELPPVSSGYDHGKAVLDVTNPHQNVVFAQVARPGMRTVNVAIPPAGALRPVRCHLVVASHTDVLEAHVRLSTDWANSALQYMSQGRFDEAKQLVETASEHQSSPVAQTVQKIADWFVDPRQPSRAGRIVQRIVDRFEDPAAALVPRYLGLRTREDTVFKTLGDFLFDVLQGISDGLVISAEIAARQRLYKTAALRILSIQPGGLPLFAEGFSLLVHRTKELTDLDESDAASDQLPGKEEIEKLKVLLRTLFKWAPYLNLKSPTVTFRGNNVTAPQENEDVLGPNVQDAWISSSELEKS